MSPNGPEQFDVIIIGTGSGNSILTPEYDSLKVGIVEKGVFGGTCLNRGCIPTKMFVYAADVASMIEHSGRYGIDASIDKVRWPDIVDRIFDRIDVIPPQGLAYREQAANTTVFNGEATFVGPRVLDVNGHKITADNILIAAGARPFIPDINGIDSVEYHTSDTIMRLPAVPERLVILGGGYIASEMAHVFGALGSDVTMVLRSGRMLSAEDESVSERFTEISSKRFDVRLDARIDRISQRGVEIVLDLHAGGQMGEVVGDVLLVATGRVPNSDALHLDRTGVDIDRKGYIITDDYLRTTAAGIWALGDISNDNQLKHVANAEARAVAHNIIHPESLRTADLWPIPHAIFADPQVASVGLTEQDLRHMGQRHVVSIQNYSDVAYGWAMEDTDHFCKLIADPDTHLLLGAHIIGPHASMLIQQLIQGMKFGQTVEQMARGQLYIHPSLSEVVENALLQFMSE